jgi:hypothetical protein
MGSKVPILKVAAKRVPVGYTPRMVPLIPIAILGAGIGFGIYSFFSRRELGKKGRVRCMYHLGKKHSSRAGNKGAI